MAAKSHSDDDHHDWHSKEYVIRWAERQNSNAPHRNQAFELVAETIPYSKTAPIKILDIGAGYGGLTQFLLEHFPKASAICQDGSKEMADLGKAQMKNLKGRFSYVISDLREPRWSRKLKTKGPFDAVVSSIAIHNVRDPEIIHRIYKDIFTLVKSGGCFLDLDTMHPSLELLLKWLDEAGFKKVQCFWQSGRRGIVGGFKMAKGKTNKAIAKQKRSSAALRA